MTYRHSRRRYMDAHGVVHQSSDMGGNNITACERYDSIRGYFEKYPTYDLHETLRRITCLQCLVLKLRGVT